MNEPNETTAAVIEFLTQPGSDFGTQPTDIDALRSVETLAGELRLRLETLSPESSDQNGNSAGQPLVQRLSESDLCDVDWLHVMQELRIRLRLADGFFAQDVNTPKSSS
jgi:hypothetical protein